jgi:DNA polymerase III epsilon subunit-like protein
MKTLWMDTETGGFNAEKHSLLTIALAVYDSENVIDIKEWKIKHKDYLITADSLTHNKIDIIEHHKVAKEKEVVVKEIIEFIKINFSEERPALGGQNIKFDIGFVDKLFKDCKEYWNKYVSHRTIDTCEITRFMFYSGKITEDVAALDKAIKYFDIEVDGRHTSSGDILATIKLFEKLREI